MILTNTISVRRNSRLPFSGPVKTLSLCCPLTMEPLVISITPPACLSSPSPSHEYLAPSQPVSRRPDFFHPPYEKLSYANFGLLRVVPSGKNHLQARHGTRRRFFICSTMPLCQEPRCFTSFSIHRWETRFFPSASYWAYIKCFCILYLLNLEVFKILESIESRVFFIYCLIQKMY
jgi:hypothetical protein